MRFGIFQNVELADDELIVGRDVSAFYFTLSQLDGCDRELVLEVILSKGGEPNSKIKDDLHIEFETLLPKWVLRKIKVRWSLSDTIMNLACSAEAGNIILENIEKIVPEKKLHECKVDWNLHEALIATCNDGKTVDFLLDEVIDQFEELLTLQIGLDTGGIFFSVRFDPQKISIWDRVLSERSVSNYIKVKQN